MAMQVPIEGIRELSQALRVLESNPYAFLIRGSAVDPEVLTKNEHVRRLKDNFRTSERGKSWALIDFDDIELPESFTVRMRPTLSVLALVGVASTAFAIAPALAADVGVSVSVGQPGFYGRIDIGNFPRPQVIYTHPVVIQPVAVMPQPIYLHVPPGHAKDWRKHCRKYSACNQPVYFVREDCTTTCTCRAIARTCERNPKPRAKAKARAKATELSLTWPY
jgi:hypothetical protein